MYTLGGFYRQTWWLWLLLAALFTVLAVKVSVIVALLVPGILLYSIYFGTVRTTELNEAEKPR